MIAQIGHAKLAVTEHGYSVLVLLDDGWECSAFAGATGRAGGPRNDTAVHDAVVTGDAGAGPHEKSNLGCHLSTC